MPSSYNKSLLCATAASVITAVIGAVFAYRRYRYAYRLSSSLLKQLPELFVINSSKDWLEVIDKFQRASLKKKVIGLDCEWRPSRTSTQNPVALLQLAIVEEFCILIRLNKLMNDIPAELKSILEDKRILKVGVGIRADALKLLSHNQVIVKGCLDLRHMANRIADEYAEMDHNGLKALTEKIFDVQLDKGKVRMSDWEAEELSDRQIEYAARDAMAGALIFEHLASEMFAHRVTGREKIISTVVERFDHLLDVPYKDVTGLKYRMMQKTSSNVDGLLGGRHQTLDHNSNSFPSSKTNTRAYSVRQTPLYHNCQLLAPDGETLCTCDTKKAVWYLQRDLAHIVSEDPLVIKLKFEPSGRPDLDNKYYVEEKENQCVVCGKKESLVRKLVVPHEYRKFFPKVMKSHLSHDVLLLCVDCHLISNHHDTFLRQQLAVECGAPLSSGEGAKAREDPELRKVKSAGRALSKFNPQLPPARKTELESILKEFYQVSDLTETLINVAADIETNYQNENYVIHGEAVVGYASKHGGLLALETRWRKHFLNTMKPHFLPKMWSVHHNHKRLALQVATDQNTDFDINILGLSANE